MRNFRKPADRQSVTWRAALAVVNCIEGLEARTLFAATLATEIDLAPPTPNPYASGTAGGVTLEASVFDVTGGGTPTGQVQFLSGSTLIGSPVTLVGGTAVLTDVTALKAGNDVITAVYSGDSSYLANTSTPMTEVVTGAGTTTVGTTTTVSSSTPNVAANTPVTFTASVSPDTTGGSAVSGTVTFYVDNVAQVPAGAVGSNGKATFSSSGLSAGMHSITASYSGDTNYDPSNSTAFTETVFASGLTATSTTVSTSMQTITAGNSITLTATISQNAATGMVQFYSNGSVIGTPQTVTGGIATLTTSSLATGSDSITAIYSGDSTYATSTSPAVAVTVLPGALTATTTTVTTSNGTTTVGMPVTFTATLDQSAATGTVQFYADGNLLGAAQAVSGGVASLTTTSLSAGSRSITAVYSGDSAYATSTSPAITEMVNPSNLAPTTITVTAPQTTITVGSSITFTATIDATGATGTIQFFSNGVQIGSQPVSNGAATLTTSTLSSGTDTITATYGGDSTYATSSSPAFVVTVNPSSLTPTSTTITSSSPTSTVGSPVTFTADVSPAAAGGTVQFYDNGVALGAARTLVGGTASLTTAGLSIGSYSITATYSGNGTYASSTAPAITETITPAALTPTTTTVTSSAPNATAGTPITFTATVSPAAATGTVQFYSNGTQLGTPQALVGGVASYNVASGLSAGTFSITAVYSGDSTYATSTSTPIAQISTTVLLTPTTTAVTSTSATTTVGTPVTLSATITPSAATGSVQFFSNGTALDVPQPVVGGVATLTTSALLLGTDTITATYSGDTTYATSTSPGFTETVNMAVVPTTTTLTLSSPTSTAGNSVILTATVAPGTASGTVQFFDGTTALGAPVALVNGVATLTTAAFNVGDHTLTANYSGDTGDMPSVSASADLVVAQGAAVLTLTSSAATTILGMPVTFTATVAPAAVGGPLPTGSVDFFDGMTDLSMAVPLVNGMATFTTSALAVGSHSISFTYIGDTNYLTGTANPITQTVNPIVSTVTLVPSSNPSVYNIPISLTAIVTPTTATGSVIFYNGTTPLGAEVVTNGSATLNDVILPPGSNRLTVVYSGDTNDAPATSAVVVENITRAPSTTMVVASSPTVVYGNTITLTASIVPLGANGSVRFYSNGVLLGTGTVVGGSVAAIQTGALPVGSDSITAVYSGNTSYQGSTSTAITENVTLGSAVASVYAFPNEVSYGAPVTLTATVDPSLAGTAQPTGTVTLIEDGSTTLASNLQLVNGTVSFTTTALSLGDNTITVVYNGDSNYTPVSAVGAEVLVSVVTASTSSTTLSASPASSSFGDPVTFTASVAPVLTNDNIPTGPVTFYYGSTAISAPTYLVNGTATFTSSSLPPGSDYVTAVYAGDTNFTPSTSAPVVEIVTGTANTGAYVTSLNVSSPSAAYGNAVTLTASVVPAIPGAPTPSGGTVTFFSGTQTLGAAQLGADGTAVYATPLPAGANQVTAAYNGGGPITASLPATVTVSSPATPSLAKATLPPAIVFGTAYTSNVPVVITNLSAAHLKGPFTIDVYVDSSPTLDNNKILLSMSSHSFVLNPHKPRTFRKLETIPSNLPASTYYLIAQVTDPNGLTNQIASSPIVVAAPFVKVGLATTPTNPPNIGIGQSATMFVTVTNDGNETASGLLNLTLNPSSDGQTADTSKVLGVLSVPNVSLAAGKSRRFRLTLDSTSLAVGSYFPYLTASIGGVSTSIVGSTAFTVG